MTLTHIFFDLHGTLIDGVALHPCYSGRLGVLLAQRFGREPRQWADANRRVLSDWDHYYADLDLTGENGIEDMWEGLLRTTCALFRIVGVALPDAATLQQLSRELPGLVTSRCNALYPDCAAVLWELHEAGYVMGVTTHAITGQARGVLNGGQVLNLFAGPVLGPDLAGRFQKDETFFRIAAARAGVEPAYCLLVDDSADSITGAKAAGMRAVQIIRRGGAKSPLADLILHGSLAGLTDYLRQVQDGGR